MGGVYEWCMEASAADYNYTDGQVGVFKRFLWLYNVAPQLIALGDGFVRRGGLLLSVQESKDLELLVQMGVFEHKQTPVQGEVREFYRVSDKGLEEIGKLRASGKI